ncbi:S1C family serine protease [Herbaspirillum aquaticum]|uniref:S1C family serine protease n=1 Tax=Herbaspirillum aquaticum TaxID=568783 RepID=UPI0024DE8B74|nr:serine protease [Herbaspirillum aquaticum]
MIKTLRQFRRPRVALLPPMAVLLACALGLAPEAQGSEALMPAVENKTPLQMPAQAAARPAYLARAQRRFDQGSQGSQVIGELQGGVFCTRKNEIVWNQNSAEVMLPANALFQRFRSELQQHGYPVPSAPAEPLFREQGAEAAGERARPPDFNLQVGVIIDQLQTNLCGKGSDGWTGEAYVRLEWQVFAPEQRKVIYRGTSEGVFRSRERSLQGNAPPIPLEAFGVAVRNLLADPRFALALQSPYDSVAAASSIADSAGSRSAAPPGRPLSIDNQAAERASSEIAKRMPELRSAVVTVLTERGSGTGFYIGSSGWLLTNQHVIGQAGVVRVRLPTGRELQAEVVRVDAARDIALLKTEAPGVRPMPLRMGEPGIGEDVYALGSPLGDAFNTTLTRGILSGVRKVRDLDFLQSDVAILPGSSGGPLLDKSGQVIGITVAGLGAKGLAGMNFFIPVGSALERLQLKLQNLESHKP